jgi:hypothetical protein
VESGCVREIIRKILLKFFRINVIIKNIKIVGDIHFKVSSQVTQTHNKLAVFETSNKMVLGDFITGNKLGAGNVDTTQFFDVFLFL